jgi:hypothetical protein
MWWAALSALEAWTKLTRWPEHSCICQAASNRFPTATPLTVPVSAGSRHDSATELIPQGCTQVGSDLAHELAHTLSVSQVAVVQLDLRDCVADLHGQLVARPDHSMHLDVVCRAAA